MVLLRLQLFGNLIYLISTELAALKEISEMCGEVKSKDKEKTVKTKKER